MFIRTIRKATINARPPFVFHNRRPFASDTPLPPVDFNNIPKSRMDNDPNDPQYFGSYKQSGIDPQIGDYPLLKWEGAQQRDPYGTYDDMQDKRNYGEILHHEDELLSGMAPDVHSTPSSVAAFQLAIVCGIFYGIWCAAKHVTLVRGPDPAASYLYSYPDYIGNKELADLDLEEDA